MFELGTIILFVRSTCQVFAPWYQIMKLGNETYNLAVGASKCIQTT